MTTDLLLPRATRSVPAERIHTLDVLRGVAICGILLMNIHGMGDVADYPLSRFPATWNAEWISWGVQTVFVQGAMRGLFTMLFGASMLIMLRRAEGAAGPARPLDVWTRRSVALMGFGIAQWALFLWPGEILWNYGISGLFLLAFRSARPRTLLVAAALLIAGLGANSAFWTHEQVVQLERGQAATARAQAGGRLDADDRAAIAAERQHRAAAHPDAEDRAERITERTHLLGLLHWSAGYWMRENLTITGWVDIAESIAFMLIGMALFRFGILTGTARPAIYRAMVVGGYGGGMLLRGLHVALLARAGLDMGSPLVPGWAWVASEALFQPARLLVTIGHVGAVVLLFRAGAFGHATTLRALGRMTLSVYCLQSILGGVIFYGLGYVGVFTLPQLWLIAVGIWGVSALLCRWWLTHHEMGPAETLLRRIAYGGVRAKAQPAPL
ncbi:DUF418 domain-containing protein [Sphingomonas sp. RP10(2022)]|uniref:DUF418 domain-containing protein n=1 Tax=Sphingomonas liriopis TaxID=2949094 RepID=A0A9X2HUZ2_9SPHN|nr:DUF418 domain-containing protein [Sphingomonas liriopis]MCP3734706.1 DUF418 domain-containing protein [Sphingomonas liriopis]